MQLFSTPGTEQYEPNAVESVGDWSVFMGRSVAKIAVYASPITLSFLYRWGYFQCVASHIQ